SLYSKEINKVEFNQYIKDFSEESLKIQKVRAEKGENNIVDYYIWNSEKPTNLNPKLVWVEGVKLIRG
ncbi:MAG: hypothetical protein Q8862_08340, partial [Bacteroidota bacterium]|nr:hypothetical protein [Bacteroidota bacterium]